MSEDPPTIECPAEIVDLKYPLEHFRTSLNGKGSVRIVAMGSSSTAGRGDVVPYPYRLEMYLRRHYKDDDPRPDIRIDLFNRGKGGEEASKELDRFATDIFPHDPSLVIWQVGTNAVFRYKEYDVDVEAAKIEEGLAQLRGRPLDVLLIDPQYVSRMLWDDRAELSDKMVRLIRAAAERAEVNLFQRWALMRHWHVENNVSFEQLLDTTDPDKLHQGDWSTWQVALALSKAIIKAAALTA